jgi:hypothetical protein
VAGGMSFVSSISEVPGAPASVRIGVVTSTAPLRVNVQGTEYQDLGYIGSLPGLGDTVALLGQSTSVTSSPSSWLVLGTVINGE